VEMALEVFSDMSERLDYNLPGFPVYARKGELRHFDRHAAACHWHPDLEFILILNGAMDYFVNGQTLSVNKGEGIFVNSKRLHYGFSDDKTDCSFIVVVVHPIMLGLNTPIGKAFCELKFGFYTNDYFLLKAETKWQEKILTLIKQIFDEVHKSEENPLYILSLVTSLCACTAENLHSSLELRDNNLDVKSWMAIRNMTGFIFQNYGNKITLDDIAASGSVCRSKCCQLFSEYIGQTPNNYLTGYRIGKSCEMLKESNMSVLEVSMACGFQSPSYFTSIFQKEIGLTPREYRNHSHL
jgi:AraC family transcriptional regulator, melibiose operon regulatory protein